MYKRLVKKTFLATHILVLLTIIPGFPIAATSWFFNGNWQTCLRGDGKTLKVVLRTEFCCLCDKQVISSALVFSMFFKLPSSLRDSGNFLKTLKIRVKLILNFPRAHANTYLLSKGVARYEGTEDPKFYFVAHLNLTAIRCD